MAMLEGKCARLEGVLDSLLEPLVAMMLRCEDRGSVAVVPSHLAKAVVERLNALQPELQAMQKYRAEMEQLHGFRADGEVPCLMDRFKNLEVTSGE